MPRSRRGAGPKVPKKGLLGSGSKNRTNSPRGGAAGQVTPGSGMNVGGLTDAQVRTNVATEGRQESKQLRKNKSKGLKP